MALVAVEHSRPSVRLDPYGSIPTAHLQDLAEEQHELHDDKCLCGSCRGGMRLRVWSGEQLLCAALVAGALRDALRLGKDGIPTPEAKSARLWVGQRLDPHRSPWERGQWEGSFQWCMLAISRDGVHVGRPPRTIEEWRHAWLERIDRVWSAACGGNNRPHRQCFAKGFVGRLCASPALRGSLFCAEHQAAALRFASAPDEPELAPKPNPTPTPQAATVCARAQRIEERELPDLQHGEAYSSYWRYCTQVAGVPAATPMMWGALQQARAPFGRLTSYRRSH